MQSIPPFAVFFWFSLSLPCSAFAQSSSPVPSASSPAPPSASSPAPSDNRSTDFHTAYGIVVTAPYAQDLNILGHVSTLKGDELTRDIRGQIGDSLTRQAGISTTGFAPGASRPILRGLGGERVSVLTNSLGTIDASGTSEDHGVSIDTLTIEQIEILRGPAVLLFSGQAIAGAINVLDRRIPRRLPEAPFHFDALGGYGSAAEALSGGLSFDVQPVERFVVHAHASYRDADSLRSGGRIYAAPLREQLTSLAASARAQGDDERADDLIAAADSRGRIDNSQSSSKGGTLGASFIDGDSHFGVSFGYTESDYGIAGRADLDEEVTIHSRQYRADLRGEVELGEDLFDILRVSGAYGDYSHTEFEDGETGTIFTNQGIEFRTELVQNERGGWRGISGTHYVFRDFDAIGDEAFVPGNETQRIALFMLQSYQTGALILTGSLRYENSKVRAPTVSFSRSFNSVSGAAGLGYDLNDTVRLGVSLSRSQRAPSSEELLSDGPHIATQNFELGNPDFAKENSWATQASIRVDRDDFSLSFAAYMSWFDNFIFSDDSGLIREELPLFIYQQSDARLWGLELESSARLAQWNDTRLMVDLTADLTRAKINNSGPMPRIPPLRLLAGIEVQDPRFDARAEIEWTDKQNRITAFETATDGFTFVNLTLAWRLLPDNKNLTLTLSANNVFDVLARRHASFTKDYVPLTGRDIRVGLRASF